MRVLLHDLRYAVRQLRGNPGVTGLVVLTVALGIGANTALFSLVNGLSRPLPVPAPGQIVFLAAQTKGDTTGLQFRLSYPAVEDLRQQADRFSDIFAFNARLAGLAADGRVTQFFYSAVTGNYFPALGVQPAAGRLFVRGEGDKAGSPLVVVLGYSYWQKQFGGSSEVIGKQVRLNGKTATVVGVAAKGFYGLYGGAEMDGYLPLDGLTIDSWDFSDVRTDRLRRPFTVVARMKPGVTVAEAQSSVNVVARRLGEQYPGSDKDIGIRVIPELVARPIPVRYLAELIPTIHGLTLTLAGLVLLLACLNVANILMVRATVREREMAIRAALGSRRGRLVRQMLTESLLLSILGAAGGLLVGKWASIGFAASIDLKTDFPVKLDFSFDWRVFTYALAAAVVTGVAIGIWPALRASRADASAVLHDSTRSNSAGGGRARVRSLLVVAQVAGSLVLLVVAGLFARSLQQAQRVDLGFDADGLLNARMDPIEIGYGRPKTSDFYRELKRRVRDISGVQAVSLAFTVPMGYVTDSVAVYPDDRPIVPGERPAMAGSNSVDPDYFDTMRIPVVSGRAFRESDNETAPLVAIVNQTMARRFWPGQDAVGKRFRTKPGGPLWQVVGVARDSKYVVVFENRLEYAYFPCAQSFTSMRVLQVRSRVPPESLRPRVQREILGLDAAMPIADLQTMRQSLAGGMGFMMFRVGAIQAGAMGLLGLVLAAIGIYGVVSYSASQRTREIGIRMALGAVPADVRSLVLGQGLLLVAEGVAAGLLAAAALARFAAKFILLPSAVDPLTFTVVTVVLAAIALAACYIPARRAMRVNPIEALRHE